MSKFAASSFPNLGQRQHAIYGLYLPNRLGTILYAGSWRVATLDERLRQHRAGECRTSTKMATRTGVHTNDLSMRVLAYWMSGIEPNPEGEIIIALQTQGQCRWNHPYAFTAEDCKRGDKARGAYKMHETWGKTPEAHEIWVRIGRIGGHKGNREGKARGGRIGGLIGGHLGNREGKARGARRGDCARWHNDRVKVNRLCEECAAKSLYD